MSYEIGVPRFGRIDLEDNAPAIMRFVIDGSEPGKEPTYFWRADKTLRGFDDPRYSDANELTGIHGCSHGDKFFLTYLEESHDPTCYLIAADELGEAYDDFVNFASGHLGIRIEESELADYGVVPMEWNENLGVPSENFDGKDWSNFRGEFDDDGNPVDVESIRIFELRLLSIEFSVKKD